MENTLEANPEPRTERKQKAQRAIWDLIKFVFTVLIIVVPIRAFVAQPFIVSGESMSPTFETRDYLIIDEISYHIRNPERGEVIVFHPPGQSDSVYYIKRVIGLPGETVKIENGVITIINKENPNGFVLNEPYIKFESHESINQTLKEGEYYVLGDNRARSSDSRYWGTLPRKNIVGRALVRLYPFNEITVLPGEHSFATEQTN